MLIGTRWKHPEHGEMEVGKAQQGKEKHEGEDMEHPEITLKYWGKRMSVSGFLHRIDPKDIGDIKPFGREAEKIVSIQNQNSWRNMEVSFE